MNSFDPHSFASQWIANWNARNVEGVLFHFRDDCWFESPIAKTITGNSLLNGKEQLRSYWNAALAKNQNTTLCVSECHMGCEKPHASGVLSVSHRCIARPRAKLGAGPVGTRTDGHPEVAATWAGRPDRVSTDAS